MKKIAMFMSALALTFAFTSCDEKEGNNGGVNLDEVTEDGFFVAGPATGAEKIGPEYMMTAGVNEVLMDQQKLSWDESKRDGMFEKYIVLEADKEFELLLNEAGVQTRYSATLEAYKAGETSDGTIDAFRGELKVGADAPAMKVSKTALYHIVLDLNTNNDLLYPQIIVVPVTWGVRGGMNGWGFTAFPEPEAYTNEGITWVLENQELGKNGEFKFAHDGIWKLQLDDAGNVKAHTNLGDKSQNGGDNIKVEKAGYYKVTLNFALKGGTIADSYTYTVECTEESSTPTEMYIIGNEFGNWDWAAETVVTMNNVHSHPGCFWAVRYMTTNTEFKFCAVKEWNGDFTGLGTNTGFVTPDNNKVEADGLYMIYVDLVNDAVTVEPAKIYGMGPVFTASGDSWAADVAPFTIADKATITVDNAGNLRMYADAPSTVEGVDWWQMEFNIYDGKIVYRGEGGDQAAVEVAAGQTVTLDFNTESGSIQ